MNEQRRGVRSASNSASRTLVPGQDDVEQKVDASRHRHRRQQWIYFFAKRAAVHARGFPGCRRGISLKIGKKASRHQRQVDQRHQGGEAEPRIPQAPVAEHPGDRHQQHPTGGIILVDRSTSARPLGRRSARPPIAHAAGMAIAEAKAAWSQSGMHDRSCPEMQEVEVPGPALHRRVSFPVSSLGQQQRRRGDGVRPRS